MYFKGRYIEQSIQLQQSVFGVQDAKFKSCLRVLCLYV